GGLVSSITDRAGRTCLYSYSSGQLIVALTAHDSEMSRPGTRYAYGFSGQRVISLAVTNPENEVTSYTFDPAGRTTNYEHGSGAGESYSITHAAAAIGGTYSATVFDPLNRTRVYQFDSSGRVTSFQNGGVGETTTFQWTGSRPTSITGPDGLSTTIEWTG